MIGFKEYITQENIFQRFKNHFKNNKPMIFISGNRSENTSEQNEKNYFDLKKFFNIKQYDVNTVIGGYVENVDGEKKEVKERTLLVYSEPEDEDRLRNDGIHAGHIMNQEAILYIDSKGKAYYINLEPLQIEYIGKNITQKDVENFYTQIRNKKFKFI